MQTQIQKQSIGIIGGGISGLSAGYFLKRSNPALDVTIFQSTAKVGGRANTFVKSIETSNQQKTDLIFDHGANYFTQDNAQHEEFLNKNLFTNPKFQENLVDIPRHIYLLDKNNVITKSERNSKKYTYKNGLRTLAQIFESECQCNFQLNKKVLSVKKLQENWQVNCQDNSTESQNQVSYTFDKIIFAIHPVSLNRILSRSEPQEIFTQYLKSLKGVSHRAIANVSLGYDITKYGKYPLTDFFALVNTDRDNDISWLCFENDKPGHIQDQKQHLGITIQMSDGWTRKTWDASKDETIALVKEKVNKLFTEQCNHQFVDQLLPQIMAENHVFQLVKKWEYAFHNNTPQPLELFTKPDQKVYNGLYFCGDFLFDKARVTNAMMSGFQASSQILNNDIQQKI